MRGTTFVLCLILALVPQLASARPSGLQKPEEPSTGLTLEIVPYAGASPAYVAVPGPRSEPRGMWTPQFRLTSTRMSENDLPVRAVHIKSRAEGDTVRILVSVFLGTQLFDKEAAVGNYLVRVDEKVVVGELSQYGLEPYSITVLRVVPALPALPSVVNKTQSLLVIGIEANPSTLPTYVLSLENRSSKAVVAVAIRGQVNGEVKLRASPRSRGGEPLIEPGATHRLTVPGVTDVEGMSTSRVAAGAGDYEIVICTAVFGDGSYEGDAENAAAMRAFEVGRRIQTERVIALLRAASENTEASPQSVAADLKSWVSALEDEPDDRSLNDVLGAFPPLAPEGRTAVRAALKVAQHMVKNDFLDRLAEFEVAHAARPNSKMLRLWLSEMAAAYGDQHATPGPGDNASPY